MSANAAPIPLERFAEAIAELPLENLRAKAAELRNSITHLISSNQQLQEYANDGDRDCADAIRENEEVIERMEMRINLLRTEVEQRGFRWGADEPATVNGKPGEATDHDGMDIEGPPTLDTDVSTQSARTTGGTLGDEELTRRLREQMDDHMHDDGDGVHL